ncbi:MAG: hypothetical protein V4547_03910 [Bacteroidota bacterium]
MDEIESALVVKKKVGELDVIANDTLHISGDQISSLEISSLTIKFSFIKDIENTESRYRGKAEGKVLTLELINFANSLGEGAIEPVKLGHLLSRKLYVSFYVYTIDLEKGLRILSYSLYLGGKKDE